MESEITKSEKNFGMLAAVIASTFMFINPYIVLPFFALFLDPSLLLDFDNWHSSLLFMFCLSLIFFYAFISYLSIAKRKIGWVLSILYNLGWLLFFFLEDSDSFFQLWIVWVGNLAVLLISIIALRKLVKIPDSEIVNYENG